MTIEVWHAWQMTELGTERWPILYFQYKCIKAMAKHQFLSWKGSNHVLLLWNLTFLKWLVFERGLPLADWCRTNLTGSSKLETLPANLFVSLPINKRELFFFLLQCIILCYSPTALFQLLWKLMFLGTKHNMNVVIITTNSCTGKRITLLVLRWFERS